MSKLVVHFHQDPKTERWTVTIPSEPAVVAQGDTLEDAYQNVRNALSLVRNQVSDIELDGCTFWEGHSNLSPDTLDALKTSGDDRLRLLAAQSRSKNSTSDAVALLMAKNFTYRQAGRLLGLTHARVEQIFKRILGMTRSKKSRPQIAPKED